MPTYKSGFVIALLFLWSFSLARAGCYHDFLTAGKKAFGELKFEEAINQFKAARICKDTIVDIQLLDSLIQKSQEEYINEIKKARNIAQLERLRADTARVVAQANQLALLSRNAQAARRDSHALIFAYGAKALFEKQAPDPVESNFSQAAFNFYKRSLPRTTNPVTRFWQMPDRAFTIVETGKGNMHLIKDGNLESGQSLDLEFIGRHNAYLTDIAYHPASEIIVSGAQDQTAMVRSQNGQDPVALSGHKDRVETVSIALDGSMIFTCDRTGNGNLWSREGKLMRTLTGHEGAIYQAFFVSDHQLVTRSVDRKIGLWNTRDQDVRFLQHEDQAYFYDLQYLENGQRLVTLNTRGEIQVWNLNGDLLHTITDENDPIRHFQIHETGKIITAGNRRVIKVWNADGKELESYYLPQFSNIRFFKYDTLHQKTIVGGKEGIVSVDLNSKERIFFPAGSTPMEVLFSPDGRYLLATYQDGMARLWSQEGLLLFEFDLETSQPIPVVFANSGRYIIASVNNNQEIAWAPLPEIAWKKLPDTFNAIDQQLERLGRETGIIPPVHRAKER